MDNEHGGTPPAPPKLPQPRNTSNHMFMSPRNQPERDAWAAERWVKDGWMLKDIAAGLGISKGAAHEAVERGLRGTRDATEESKERSRNIQRARLERAQDAAMAVLEATHVTVSFGKVITLTDDDGNKIPLTDHGPILQAIDRIVKISESFRKLESLDQPIKVDATVTEASRQDIELQEMVNEFRAKNSTTEGQLRATRKRPE